MLGCRSAVSSATSSLSNGYAALEKSLNVGPPQHQRLRAHLSSRPVLQVELDYPLLVDGDSSVSFIDIPASTIGD